MSNNLIAYERYLTAFNERRFDDLETMLDPHIVDHHLPPEVPVGAAGVLYWLRLLADSLMIEVEIEQLVDAGDLIAGRAWIAGTHVGDFPGMPATGRSFRVAMTSVDRFAGGRIVERWETFDLAGMIEQLGTVATPTTG